MLRVNWIVNQVVNRSSRWVARWIVNRVDYCVVHILTEPGRKPGNEILNPAPGIKNLDCEPTLGKEGGCLDDAEHPFVIL